MSEEEIRAAQLSSAMRLVAEGSEPDSIMLFSPEEYAKMGESAMDKEEPDFDLLKGDPDNFPPSQIGRQDILEPHDMGIPSFKNAYVHPVRTYLIATLKTLNNTSFVFNARQLEDQKRIYTTLYDVIAAAHAYYEEDMRAEKAALEIPNLNYMAINEFERDYREAERVAAGVRDLLYKVQEALRVVEELLEVVKGTRS